jgi:phage terminase large subunit-like protein
MKFFPKGAHDDAVDALEMAAKLAMTSRKRLMTIIHGSGRVEVIYNE